jgi:hypothetical protein
VNPNFQATGESYQAIGAVAERNQVKLVQLWNLSSGIMRVSIIRCLLLWNSAECLFHQPNGMSWTPEKWLRLVWLVFCNNHLVILWFRKLISGFHFFLTCMCFEWHLNSYGTTTMLILKLGYPTGKGENTRWYVKRGVRGRKAKGQIDA